MIIQLLVEKCTQKPHYFKHNCVQYYTITLCIIWPPSGRILPLWLGIGAEKILLLCVGTQYLQYQDAKTAIFHWTMMTITTMMLTTTLTIFMTIALHASCYSRVPENGLDTWTCDGSCCGSWDGSCMFYATAFLGLLLGIFMRQLLRWLLGKFMWWVLWGLLWWFCGRLLQKIWRKNYRRYLRGLLRWLLHGRATGRQ